MWSDSSWQYAISLWRKYFVLFSHSMHLLFSHMTFSPSTALCFHVMPMSCTAAASTPKLFPCESFMRDLEHFHSSHCSCATPKGIIFYCPDPGSAFLLTITRAVCKGRGSEGMAFLCPPPSPPFFLFCVPISLREVVLVSAGWLPVIVRYFGRQSCWSLMWKHGMSVVREGNFGEWSENRRSERGHAVTHHDSWSKPDSHAVLYGLKFYHERFLSIILPVFKGGRL